MEGYKKMKLHEAIAQVLLESETPLTPMDIAIKINTRNLYRRKDARAVPSSQISARVNKYSLMFTISDGEVSLNSN